MTADRDTGLTVTLPLVWRGDYMYAGGGYVVGRVSQSRRGGKPWLADVPIHAIRFPSTEYPILCDTRAEAEQAVEAAVMAALGGKP